MTKDPPKVSIIIPHWNGIEILSECIGSLKKTRFDSYEIIVCDNASTDGSQNWIKENHPMVTLLENDRNYGYAGGCNRGAEIANGDYLVFLNNDTIQDSDWLGHLVKCIEGKDEIAAVQPKILNYFDRTIFDYAGGSGGHMDIFCYPFARGRLFLEQEKDNGQYDDAAPCFWASGTSMMVKKDLFIKAGKFDEVFFAHMEEIDLCWRLQAMGYQVWVEPESRVLHKNAVSLPMHSHRKYYLNHRNSLLMIFSNYSIPNSFYLGTIRIMLEFIAMAYATIKLDFNHVSGIIRSLFWVALHPFTIIGRRKRFMAIRKLSDRDILKKLCRKPIVLVHFLAGKNTYFDMVSKVD
ncbi:MAG: glycosyltransferase family 2 protein [Candidatus Marinimicrobia bacterium]|jgi:hypothetical protein|nr:glycosyltransferase family 2 protein [Candidatus Neomarinimicrobiota bacterium]|tara:strand:- start:1972 stop:3021 length:1050 start_codon:yes stop_codon:yes gene_type:complete